MNPHPARRIQPNPQPASTPTPKPRLIADALAEIKALTRDGTEAAPKLAKPVPKAEASAFRASSWIPQQTPAAMATQPEPKQNKNTPTPPAAATSTPAQIPTPALEAIRRELAEIKALLAESLRRGRLPGMGDAASS
jgi:hypothetical protein